MQYLGKADLAKFFTRGDAEKHAERRHGTWRDLRVEEREESEREQHPAHRYEKGMAYHPAVDDHE